MLLTYYLQNIYNTTLTNRINSHKLGITVYISNSDHINT